MQIGVAVLHGLVDVHVFVRGALALSNHAFLHFGAQAGMIELEARARIVIRTSVLALVKAELALCGQGHGTSRASLSETSSSRTASLFLEAEQFVGVLGPLRLLEVHIVAL